MNIFGGKPPEKRRRQRKTPAERLAAQEADYLAYLKKNKPEKWQQVMEERMGIGGPREGEKPDPLTVTVQTMTMLKKAGFIKGPQDVEDNSSFVKEILEAIPAIPALLQAMQQGGGSPVQPVQQPIGQPALPAGAPAEIPAPRAEPPRQPTQATGEEEKMDVLVDYIKNSLSGKSASEAARWMASQPHPMAQSLVSRLAEVPEGQAFDWLLNMCSSQPGLKPLGRWIEAQGEVWVRSISRELKVLRSGTAASG